MEKQRTVMNSFICLRSMRLCSSRCSAPVRLPQNVHVSSEGRARPGLGLELTRPLQRSLIARVTRGQLSRMGRGDDAVVAVCWMGCGGAGVCLGGSFDSGTTFLTYGAGASASAHGRLGSALCRGTA